MEARTDNPSSTQLGLLNVLPPREWGTVSFMTAVYGSLAQIAPAQSIHEGKQSWHGS